MAQPSPRRRQRAAAGLHVEFDAKMMVQTAFEKVAPKSPVISMETLR